VFEAGDFIYVFNERGSTQVNKNTHGSLLILYSGTAINPTGGNFTEYEILESSYAARYTEPGILREGTVTALYSALIEQRAANFTALYSALIEQRRRKIVPEAKPFNIIEDLRLEKRSYIKHIVRMRYR
jgi:hypothetical protein